jgi:hypothetical protein
MIRQGDHSAGRGEPDARNQKRVPPFPEAARVELYLDLQWFTDADGLLQCPPSGGSDENEGGP